LGEPLHFINYVLNPINAHAQVHSFQWYRNIHAFEICKRVRFSTKMYLYPSNVSLRHIRISVCGTWNERDSLGVGGVESMDMLDSLEKLKIEADIDTQLFIVAPSFLPELVA